MQLSTERTRQTSYDDRVWLDAATPERPLGEPIDLRRDARVVASKGQRIFEMPNEERDGLAVVKR